MDEVEKLDGKQFSNIFKNVKAKLLMDMQIKQDDDWFDDEKLNSLIYFYDDDEVSKRLKDYINEIKVIEQTIVAKDNNTNYNETEIAINITVESVDIKRPDERKTKAQGGGYGNRRVYNSNSNTEIGLKGEKYVYDILIEDESIKEVHWISGNAQKYGECSHGDDSLGYDIYYLLKDEPKEIHYVEVKATTGDTFSFHLTRNEKEFGESHKKYYEIMLVTKVNSSCPQINKLGHVFDYSLNEDFFSSSQFIVETDSFAITAQKA